MQGNIETRVGIFVLAAIGVFMYMGFKIGSFRFDRHKYNDYIMYFTDISGLSRKADVKIAGVKVGWVEHVNLITDGSLQAEARVMILKDFSLYHDAYAIVRQDGLLGPKYVEVTPGNPLLPRLQAGDVLIKPTTAPVSVDELLHQFKAIASNVQEVTHSFKEALGGPQGADHMRELFDNLHATAQNLAQISGMVNQVFVRNEQHFDAIAQVGTNINAVTQKLEHEIFPVFKDGIEKISSVLDRDFNRVATHVETSADALEQASVEAREGLRNFNSITEKIDEGKGVLGKLVNDDEAYHDLRLAIQGFKNYLTKVDRLAIIFDSHFESMHRPAENYEFEDSKGYLDIRIHPNEDHFYLLQFVNSQKGFVTRKQVDREYCDLDGRPVDPTSLNLTDGQKLNFVFTKKKEKFKRNTMKFGIQFGKIYKDIAFRLGLFEGSAGLGVDIDLPFNSDKFRWITTLELFDMSGWNRKDDRRPHLKWLNRMYIMNNIYITFGADDFASKRNATGFVGAGVRFGDDDIKYLLSNISGVGSTNLGQTY